MAPDGHAEIGYKITGICSAVNTLPAPSTATPTQHLHSVLVRMQPGPPQPAPTLHPNGALRDPAATQCTLTLGPWSPRSSHALVPALEL